MAIDSVRRSQLLKQIKRGRNGATQWTRIFLLLVTAGVVAIVQLDVFKGKENFHLLASALVMLFLLATGGIGLGILEMNERFRALLDLIEEDE